MLVSQEVVDLASDVAFEAAQDLGAGVLLGLLSGDVGLGGGVHPPVADRDHVQGGVRGTGTTTLRVRGISAAELGRWPGRVFAREDVMLAGHPEHYSIHAQPGLNVNIVETLDTYVCSFFMRPWGDSVIAEHDLMPEPLVRARWWLDFAEDAGEAGCEEGGVGQPASWMVRAIAARVCPVVGRAREAS